MAINLGNLARRATNVRARAANYCSDRLWSSSQSGTLLGRVVRVGLMATFGALSLRDVAAQAGLSRPDLSRTASYFPQSLYALAAVCETPTIDVVLFTIGLVGAEMFCASLIEVSRALPRFDFNLRPLIERSRDELAQKFNQYYAGEIERRESGLDRASLDRVRGIALPFYGTLPPHTQVEADQIQKIDPHSTMPHTSFETA